MLSRSFTVQRVNHELQFRSIMLSQDLEKARRIPLNSPRHYCGLGVRVIQS